MFQALFNIIINLLATLIQLILTPFNATISGLFPDLSNQILSTTSTISNMFSSINWALGLVPDTVLGTVLFIVTLEIAKHSVYVFSHVLIKVWVLVQKLKFW